MPRKKKIEEKTLPLEEILIEENLTEDFEEDEDGEEEPKPQKRTRKVVTEFVFADELHMKALYYIDLFGATDLPVFTNVIETEFKIEEDEEIQKNSAYQKDRHCSKT